MSAHFLCPFRVRAFERQQQFAISIQDPQRSCVLVRLYLVEDIFLRVTK